MRMTRVQSDWDMTRPQDFTPLTEDSMRSGGGGG